MLSAQCIVAEGNKNVLGALVTCTDCKLAGASYHLHCVTLRAARGPPSPSCDDIQLCDCCAAEKRDPAVKHCIQCQKNLCYKKMEVSYCEQISISYLCLSYVSIAITGFVIESHFQH